MRYRDRIFQAREVKKEKEKKKAGGGERGDLNHPATFRSELEEKRKTPVNDAPLQERGGKRKLKKGVQGFRPKHRQKRGVGGARQGAGTA